MPDLDLTTEPEPSTTEPVSTEPYDPRPKREQLRGYLALGLLLLVALVILAALIGMFASLETTRIKDIMLAPDAAGRATQRGHRFLFRKRRSR